MVGPILALAASVLTGWVLLQSQGVFPLSSFWTLDLSSVSASLAVFALSSTAAYAVCLRYRLEALDLLRRSKPLASARDMLFYGFWFDRAYSAAFNGLVLPLSRGVAKIQTELIRANSALVLAFLAIIFVLFAVGVL